MGGTQRAAVSSVSAGTVRLLGVRNNRNTLNGTKLVVLILSTLGSSRDRLRNNSASRPGAAILLSQFMLRLQGCGCTAGKAGGSWKGTRVLPQEGEGET